MSNLITTATPSDWKDAAVRAVKAAVSTFVGVLGANLAGWTNVANLKAAGIAGAATAFTILLNLVLTWTTSP